MMIDARQTDPAPQYLLFSEARIDDGVGSWRFVLTHVGAGTSLTALDSEPTACRERLELLAVVRGLEAIDQPAQVTLVTGSRYVSRGLKRGLAEWRAQDWQWERFGELAQVRDHDLWRRVDRALTFHEVECRWWRLDAAAAPPTAEQAAVGAVSANRGAARRMAPTRVRRGARAPGAWGGILAGSPLATG
ncbi:MAG TPA: hypothetical protein PKC18_07545 [Lacipirellulaceae bacterium]|nr:hypothetical protein [Lacipirellulaceae bacterium]